METKITMLPVSELYPHRDNPRKELGDLTELAESIKANGVMQNLTVIPIEEAEPETDRQGYTVIIGHRRLEAAKLAGLNEVPCVITHMDREREKFFRTATPRKRAVVAAYSCCGDGKDKDVHDYDGNYTNDYTARECRRIYDALKILGYEPSDEEREYINGTHKAYKIKEGGR